MKTQHNFKNSLILGKSDATRGASSNKTLYEKYGLSSSRAIMVKHLYNEFKFKVWWYIIFLTLATVCLILAPYSYLTVLEVLVVLVSIDLVGRAKLSGHIVALIEVFLYGYISYKNGLYGEVFKSLVINLGLTIFAIVSWAKSIKQSKTQNGAENKKAIKIKKLSYNGWIVSSICFALICVGAYFALGAIGTTSLLLSAITFSISVVCKALNALCYKESWFLQIVQSTISLCLWVSVLIAGGLSDLSNLPMLVAYLAAITNAIYSYMMWRAMYKKAVVNGGRLFALRPLKVNKIVKLRRRYKTLVWNKQVDMAKNS